MEHRRGIVDTFYICTGTALPATPSKLAFATRAPWQGSFGGKARGDPAIDLDESELWMMAEEAGDLRCGRACGRATTCSSL